MCMHDLTILTEDSYEAGLHKVLLGKWVSEDHAVAHEPCAEPKPGKGRLALAPWWVSLISFVTYLYLWQAGVVHLMYSMKAQEEWTADHSALYYHVGCLCSVYAVETLIAIIFERTTLLNWRFTDFLMHHVPFALVTGAFIMIKITPGAMRYTMSFDLMTSLNEAVLAARALGAPSWIDIPNKFYLLVLMSSLFVFECYELASVLTDASNLMMLRALALVGFAAAAYHAFFIIPHCLKSIRRYASTKMGHAADKANGVKAH